MLENLELNVAIKNIADSDSKESVAEELLKTPYEQLLNLINSMKNNQAANNELPALTLAKGLVRMPGEIGPVGPTGQIKDILL